MIKRWKRLSWRLFLSRLLSLARSPKRAFVNVSLAIVLGLSLGMTVHAMTIGSEPSGTQSFVGDGFRLREETIAQAQAPDFPLQPHPLPPGLAALRSSKADDYFDQIEVVPVGYLVWSQFPLTVYIQPPTVTELASPFMAQRSHIWITAVSQAVQEWSRYLPLTVVDQADGADISVLRSPPPLKVETILTPKQDRASGQLSPEPGQSEPRPTLQIGRARSAVTSYKVYIKAWSKEGLAPNTAAKPMLAHRCTIQLRPDQAPQYLQAAARHELGHALGIWGHSRSQTDVMYFSQVRQPPPISPRDLNTLKRVYEQPTRLGWAAIPS